MRLVTGSALCAGAFVLVAVAVAAGWPGLAQVDRSWSSRAFALASTHDTVRRAARLVTELGAGWLITVLTATTAVALASRRRWLLGWWLVLTVSGSALLSTAVKLGLERARPPSAGVLATAKGFSFPSGHTQAATVTYVAIVLVIGWQVLRPERWVRAVSVVGTCVVIAAVGWSRVLLGVHWPSDVLGGWLSGSAWVTAAAAVLLWLLERPSDRSSAQRAVTPGDAPPGP